MAYTADPRARFAAEGTLLAWQRRVIALLGGFGVERFGWFLQMQTHGTMIGGQGSLSSLLGVALIMRGTLIALVSARQFNQFAKVIEPSVIPPGYWAQAGVALNIVIAAVALALVVHIVWSPR